MESIIFPNPQLFLKTDFPAGYIILHVYIYIHIYIHIPLKDESPPWICITIYLGVSTHPPRCAGRRRNAPAPWAQRTACPVRKTSIEPRLQGGQSCWWNWWWVWESLPQMPEEFTFFGIYLVLVICPDIYRWRGFFKEFFSRSCAADVRKKDLSVIFTPIFGEMIQFDQHIFQMGWNHQLAWFLIVMIGYCTAASHGAEKKVSQTKTRLVFCRNLADHSPPNNYWKSNRDSCFTVHFIMLKKGVTVYV